MICKTRLRTEQRLRYLPIPANGVTALWNIDLHPVAGCALGTKNRSRAISRKPNSIFRARLSGLPWRYVANRHLRIECWRDSAVETNTFWQLESNHLCASAGSIVRTGGGGRQSLRRTLRWRIERRVIRRSMKVWRIKAFKQV
jgi:hypothetical protein